MPSGFRPQHGRAALAESGLTMETSCQLPTNTALPWADTACGSVRQITAKKTHIIRIAWRLRP